LTHTPTAQIRVAAESQRYDLVAAARTLFKLPPTQ
jgi:glutamyl-tRNA reductase